MLNKKIVIFIILNLVLLNLFNNVFAKSFSNYYIYRVFDINKEEIKWDIKENNDIKKILLSIDISKNVPDYYIKPSFLLVNEDFPDKFGTDIVSENKGINVLGKLISEINFTDDMINNNGIYNGSLNYFLFKDGINYLTMCAYDSRNRGNDTYMIIKCNQNLRKVYYIKSSNKVVNQEEYNVYIEENNKINNIKFEKEKKFANKFEEDFNQNKISLSRYGSNSKIKNSLELKDFIIDKVKKLPNFSQNDIGSYKFNNTIETISKNLYKYDDNDKVKIYTDYKRYVNYIILKYFNDIKNNEIEVVDNNDILIKEFKKQNNLDRQNAIKFSKNMLEILKKYPSKEKKLQKLKDIKEILNTKFSIDKYENQNLIGYVKDYLDIVEYSLQIQ